MNREDLEIIRDYHLINKYGDYVLTKEQLYKITDENYNLKAELGRTSEELHTLEKAKGGLEETPLAYLTSSNCLWIQNPKDENRYIPNPNAEGSYHESYCIEHGHIPIYDPNLIEHFKNQKL